MRIALTTAIFFAASTAQADGLFVTFADGAPKDSLTFQNTGCPLIDATIVVDLNNTNGQLIFDVTASGAGVEVFQPIETQADVIIAPVVDGGKVLHMVVPSFPTGSTIALTADLDDTLAGSQITVSGSEMAGATVTIASGTASETAAFGSDGRATVDIPANAEGCLQA